MRKTRNSIFQNMKLQGIMCKLGFLFSLILIFFSGCLFASENLSSDTFVHSDPVVEPVRADQPENSGVYITEGTVIFGLENISQNTEIHFSVEKKAIQTVPAMRKNRNIAAIKKVTPKTKIQQKVKSQEVVSHIHSHQSESSFTISKQQFGMGVLTVNYSFKGLIICYSSPAVLAQLSDVTAPYKYVFSFTLNTIHSHSYTRPPPFI